MKELIFIVKVPTKHSFELIKNIKQLDLISNLEFLTTFQWTSNEKYRKVVSFNTSHLEAHAGFFILLMKGIFDPYVL